MYFPLEGLFHAFIFRYNVSYVQKKVNYYYKLKTVLNIEFKCYKICIMANKTEIGTHT